MDKLPTCFRPSSRMQILTSEREKRGLSRTKVNTSGTALPGFRILLPKPKSFALFGWIHELRNLYFRLRSCGVIRSRLRIRRGESFRISEGCIAVIDVVILPLGTEHIGSDLQLQRIPHLNRGKGLTGHDQSKELAGFAKVGKLPVNELIFDHAPDLLVQHLVHLGNQDHTVAQVTVSGKKLDPDLAILFLIVTGIEQELTLINDQEDRVLVLLGELPVIEIRMRILNQEVRSQIVIINAAVLR